MKRHFYFLILFFFGGVLFANAQDSSELDEWNGWDFQYKGICYTRVGDSLHQEVEVSLRTNGPFQRNRQVNYISLDAVNIPSVVYDYQGKAYTVVGIGECAFLECYSLKRIALPHTIKYIDGWAFMGCVNLEYIEIPDHLEWIGPYVFADCSSLVKPQIPATTLLDVHAFIWAPFNSK